MQNNTAVHVFWFRRDLRLDDNAALYHALKSGVAVLPLFIFDTDILDKLEDKTDKRVQFIHQEIIRLNNELKTFGSALLVKIGRPTEVFKGLLQQYSIDTVYTNRDYEPVAIERDVKMNGLLKAHNVRFHTYKDIVVFEKHEVLKDDKTPYTIFTPYSKKWKATFTSFQAKSYPTLKYAANFFKTDSFQIPSLQQIGFAETQFEFPARNVQSKIIKEYSAQRDFPAVNGTSRLGLHLRFGTLSIRKLLTYALARNETYVTELIWRDFYHQILFHFPHVVTGAFRKEYDDIEWKNNEEHFAAWCEGRTGYQLVDAGMRELNATGYMHNRVRMVVASFLTKHLLVDWRWGEAYFAQKLLDFDLAANNGGWQWAAGCGTDAAPYFRVFNPQLQMERFDPEMKYVKHWVPEFGTGDYPLPIVEHKLAKDKVMAAYGKALKR